ncbi:MAG: Zn-ribbon domain-containing OB-fold protein [Archaeoglobaceae archaeon]|nr:Zn-ribbon domain-containing OB-fold protein [Archaeoglobaceae archaeon]MDW7989062.1 Zn-ribbon domain-containing OB-fold protein [Archaeoglobaceae archaeon]
MFLEFFKSLQEGKLIGMKCKDCGSYTCPPKQSCNKCSSRNLEKVTMSGRGIVKTYTVTYVAPMGYEKEVPYIVALVELEEGPWIIGRLDVEAKIAEDNDLTEKRVSVFAKEMPGEIFYPLKDKRIVPYFRLEG